MGIITQEKFKELCDVRPECRCPPLHEVLSEYANTPEYLRRFIAHISFE